MADSPRSLLGELSVLPRKHSRCHTLGWWCSVLTFPRTFRRPLRRHRAEVEAEGWGTFWLGPWRLRESRASRDGQLVVLAFVDREPSNPIRDRSTV